jgi:hypothetical protein
MQKDKRVNFTNVGSCIRTITNLFRNTNMKIAFKVSSTMKRHLKTRDKRDDVYSLRGVYIYIYISPP